MNTSAAGEKPKRIAFAILANLATLFWWLLLVVLVLLALYVGLGRQVTQNIDDYRPQIEQQLSEFLGQQVVIGSLSSRWNWLNPTVSARNLAVKSRADSEEIIGSLQSLRVGLDFLSSLWRFRIVFSDFNADGLDLVVNQSPRGEIKVEGADLPEPAADDLSDWIELAGQWLSDPSVRITRVALGLRDGRGQLRQVEIPQLDLIYRSGLFHASGRAMRPGTTQQLASFRLVGQHFFRGDFTGQFYGDISSGRLFDGLAQEYRWLGIQAEGFDLGGQVWMTFRDGLMEKINGILQMPYLQLGVESESLAPLENIRARFGWRRHDGEMQETLPWYAGGEFHLNDLSWRWNGEKVPGFDLRYQAGAGRDTLVADRFPIAPVRGLLSRLAFLPEGLVAVLENYRPSGTLDRLLLQLPRDESGQFRLTANLRNVNVEAHGGAPAARGLDGSLVINQKGGVVQARSAALTFGFPSLFSGLWDVRNFSAAVAWRIGKNATRVYADTIAMEFGEETRLTGAFDLKLVPGGEDVLGLKVGVENGNAGMLADFVPVGLVNEGLYTWLNTATKDADITRGRFYGHGQIGSGSPPGSFVSSMFFDFDNATVRYDDRWPEITGAIGRVFVHQGNTRVDLAAGQTGGIELRPGQVRVAPGSEDASTMIYVDVAAPVPGDALAWWMERSPLGEMAGAAADSLLVEGRFFLDLALGFALDGAQAPDVAARVSTESGSVTFQDAGLQWTDVSGELSYSTAEGFSSAPVSARFLGNPVSVWIRNSRFSDGLTLRQAGQVEVAALQNRLGLPAGSSQGVDGRLDYEAILELPSDAAATVRLISDLTGVAVNWPAPLGKSAAASAPIDITVLPGREDGIGLTIDWQQRMNLDVGLATGRVEVDVNDLRIGDRQFQGFLVEAVSGLDSWLISIIAEWVRGRVTWPVEGSETAGREQGRVVNVDLERLALARNEDQLAETDAPLEAEDPVKAFRELDFANWPDVDVRIANLQISDEDAGIWSFRLRPSASRFDVEGIRGELRSLTLDGGMSWNIANNEERTGFRGSLNGQSLADIGALFATEVPFRSDRTSIDFDLDWPGRPDQFALETLDGSASLRFDDGVILEGNSTAQLFRIFNLLNSDTLWRRLQLDFSDLYEAGVAFDAISGKARLDSGVLSFDPELQIVGPSGAFKFSGTTDMAGETLDMSMVVVLPLTQNLPLAALLLGAGVPIGGALFVLDKVLGDPLSKLTSATYSVKGTWDEPEVNLRRVFDDG